MSTEPNTQKRSEETHVMMSYESDAGGHVPVSCDCSVGVDHDDNGNPTIPADAVAAAAEALKAVAGEDIANALPHGNHFERRAATAVAAAWPIAERYWRDRLAGQLVDYARNGQYQWYGAEEGAVLDAANFIKRGVL